MKVKYSKEDDFLVIELSKKPFEYAEMENGFIVHYTKENKPVLIEVLEASRFFKETNKALSIEIKKQYFPTA